MSTVNNAPHQLGVFGGSPSGWRVDRIRDHLGPIVGGEWGDDPNEHDQGVEIPVIRVADIRGLDVTTEDLTIRRVKDSKLPGRLIGKQTVLLEKSGGGEKSPVGRAVYCRTINFDAICSNFMAKTDCASTVDPLFIIYLLDATYSCGINTANIQQTTGIQNLRVYDYLNTKVAFPPRPEQERIAAYLDASCEAIDAAAETKRRQLEALDVLRRSTLHAIFANDEWPIERIKDVANKIGSGVTPEGGASGYLDDGIPLLRSQNVHFDGLQLDDVAFISNEIHAEMASSQLKPRDVLLNITGASIGRCTFVPDDFGEGNVNQHVCFIRGNHKIDHHFLTAFLSSPAGQGQVLSAFTGASRQGLSHKELGLITIPLPDIKVQRNAVTVLKRQEALHNQVRENIEAQIEILLAYRKSLIHECVIGQRRIGDPSHNQVLSDAKA